MAQFSDGSYKQIEEQNLSLNYAVAISIVLQTLIRDGFVEKLIDFDNHLDNICADWMNVKTNEMIEEYLWNRVPWCDWLFCIKHFI